MENVIQDYVLRPILVFSSSVNLRALRGELLKR